MGQHFLTIEQFDQLMKDWHGKDIQIKKIEMDDVDHIHMQLNTISYTKDLGKNINDYESRYALQLHGDGQILTDYHYQPLPANNYEIPLQDSSLYEFDGEQFLISTDRGVYKISLHV